MTGASVPLRRWRTSTLKAARAELKPSLKSLVLVVGLAVLIGGAQHLSATALSHPQVSALFLLPVIVAVARWGVVAGAIAAIAGKAVLAYWYYPPILSLDALLTANISDFRFFINMITLAILLAGILGHQALAASRREAEMQQLYAFSRRLVRAHSTSEILDAIQSHLASLLDRRVILLWPSSTGFTCIPAGSQVPASVRTLAEGILSHDGCASGGVSAGGSDVRWLVHAVSPKTAAFGAIAVELGNETDASIERISGQIASTLADAVEALETLEIDRAIRDANVRAEADRLREATIGAVSHDLGTPLSTILCSATVLSAVPSVVGDERALGLVNAIREEAERHGKDIENLLDASRINGNAVQPKRQWTDLNDVVNSAIARLRNRRGTRDVHTRLPDDLPLVYVDTLLLERALVQVLDNAAKYSGSDTPIDLLAELSGGQIKLTVSDGGGGLTADEKALMWQRSYRGERHMTTTRGSGLGLWIAQAFVAANGGSIVADSSGPEHGTTVSILLPLPSAPPCDSADMDEGADG